MQPTYKLYAGSSSHVPGEVSGILGLQHSNGKITLLRGSHIGETASVQSDGYATTGLQTIPTPGTQLPTTQREHHHVLNSTQVIGRIKFSGIS